MLYIYIYIYTCYIYIYNIYMYPYNYLYMCIYNIYTICTYKDFDFNLKNLYICIEYVMRNEYAP